MSEPEITYKDDSAHAEVKKSSRIGRFFKHWITLVVWPLLVIILESIFGICRGMFYDPIPSWTHFILLLCCSVVAVLHGLHKGGRITLPEWFGVFRWAAIVVVFYWVILSLPLLGMGLIGGTVLAIFTIGIGLLYVIPCLLLALAPLLMMVGLMRGDGIDNGGRSIFSGFLLGVVGLGLVEGPCYITRHAVEIESMSLMRTLGSKEQLLRMCYEGGRGRTVFTDTSGYISRGFLMGSSRRNNTEQCREMYYRVTGQAFNSVKAPAGFDPSKGQRGSRFEVDFDEDLGGDGVVARVKNLDLCGSRLDGHIDSASGLGYWEWTQTFSNTDQFTAKEARMQILLPPDGVVSRLTLWVNGVPQEAAFSSKQKVTEAYKSIAVVQRRDPVLVRWVAPDRVLVQCFPVPTQGEMKIRIGITAPLDAQNRLYLPTIIEQNFGFAKGKDEVSTALWVNSDVPVQMDAGEGSLQLQRQIGIRKHLSAPLYVTSLGKESKTVWTKDQFAPADQQYLTRTTMGEAAVEKESDKIILVIDGAAGIAPWETSIKETIETLRESGHQVTPVIAAEEEVWVGDEKLNSFKGGQDNIAALRKGLALAQEQQADYLIWCHGTQPILLGSIDSLSQQIERGRHQPKWVTVDLAQGPNRPLEELSSLLHLAKQLRPSSPAEMSKEVSGYISAQEKPYQWTRSAKPATAPDAKEVWDHLARWYVWDQMQLEQPSDELVDLVSRYQLVTPVCGAVVLETKEQYKRFNLEQVDLSTTPNIPSAPEPSNIILMLMGACSLLLRRSRR